MLTGWRVVKTSRPTVVQLIFTEKVAGTERHVAELMCGLGQRGWRCIVACGPDVSAELRALYESVAEVRVLAPTSLAPLTASLISLLRRERVDLLHAHMGRALQLATLVGPVARVPVVTTLHFVHLAHSLGRGAMLRSALFRVGSRRAAKVIAVSEAVRDMARRRRLADDRRLLVVHNGVGCLGVDTPIAPRSAPSVVLCAGRLEWEKQVDVLIRVMSHRAPEAELWIAGRGSLEHDLRALSDELLPGRVRFLGFVEDLERVIDQVGIVAVPSLAEGFGMIAVDALRRGRPVVGFAAGGLPEVVDTDTGVLVTPGDEDGLGAAIRRLIEDPALGDRLGRRGRERYTDHFTADRMARQTEAVYRAALGLAA